MTVEEVLFECKKVTAKITEIRNYRSSAWNGELPLCEDNEIEKLLWDLQLRVEKVFVDRALSIMPDHKT